MELEVQPLGFAEMESMGKKRVKEDCYACGQRLLCLCYAWMAASTIS